MHLNDGRGNAWWGPTAIDSMKVWVMFKPPSVQGQATTLIAMAKYTQGWNMHPAEAVLHGEPAFRWRIAVQSASGQLYKPGMDQVVTKPIFLHRSAFELGDQITYRSQQ